MRRRDTGRLSSSAESIFWYNVSSGHDYDYYNNQTSYEPLFSVSPSAQQRLDARRVCTVDGAVDSACEYDYYLTGNSLTSNTTAATAHHYTAVRNMLGNLHFKGLTISSVQFNSLIH